TIDPPPPPTLSSPDLSRARRVGVLDEVPPVPAGESRRSEVLRRVWYAAPAFHWKGPVGTVLCGHAALPDRIPGAADGDGGDLAGHLELAHRHSACPRRRRPEGDAALRGPRCDNLPEGRGNAPRRHPSRADPASDRSGRR